MLVRALDLQDCYNRDFLLLFAFFAFSLLKKCEAVKSKYVLSTWFKL